MDLELTSRNRITKQEKNILLRDLPENVTQAELKRYFSLYAPPEEELIGFAKVEIHPESE